MKAIKECRSCESPQLIQFLDLGKQYLSDFREDDSKPPKYPIVAVLCENCKLVQLKHTVPRAEIYNENYGFRSSMSETIKADLDDIVTHAFQYKNDPKNWLDVGSGDGTLLSFVPENIYRVGVDPIKKLCVEAEKYADWIVNASYGSEAFSYYEPMEGQKTYQKFDVVTSISCFYDMPDPVDFVKGILNVLDGKGIWIIQQNYLTTAIQLAAVDIFCHEHIEYYTLFSLEHLLNRYGLEVNEVVLSSMYGGSIRTIVSRTGTYPIDESVYKQRNREDKHGVQDKQTYLEFAENSIAELNNLRRLITDLKSEGKSIYILAASTRGATIWQSAEITSEQIEYAIEKNSDKVGKYFSALGISIVSEEQGRKDNPDYMLVGAWAFVDELIDREAEYLAAGGHFIIPLPEVRVL